MTDLAAENITEYYRVAVLGELPRDGREVREIRKVAASLHEEMRNWASLEGEHKATLVSAVLLALTYRPELVQDLSGDQRNGYRDGEKVYNAAKEYLESDEADLGPRQKSVLCWTAFLSSGGMCYSIKSTAISVSRL